MIFNADTHTYTLGEHTFKRSVTELVGKYVPPFAKERIASAVANKQGRAVEDVLEQWSLSAEISCDYGNAVHKTIENWIRYKQEATIPALKSALQSFIDVYGDKSLHSEVAVYDIERSICGTVDVIERVEKGVVKIIDIKTNGEFYKKGHGKLLAPFNDLENNNLNKYRLQLSIYKKLFEGRGLTVSGIEIWHPEEGIITIEPINIENIWNAKQY